MKKILAGLTVATLAFAGVATAQDAPFAREIKARQGIMVYRAIQLGVLGGMAKGEVEYNAEAAQKAADNLMASVSLDASSHSRLPCLPISPPNTSRPRKPTAVRARSTRS